MNSTNISWTDFSANLLKYRNAAGETVWACVKKTRGCGRCYSETLALRWGRGKAFTAENMKGLTPLLTKHPERMLKYFSDSSLEDRITELWQGDDPDRQTWNIMLPLSNVHLGVSAETQVEFDERWDLLRRIPAAVRFLSLEPLLGPIDPQAQMFEDLGKFIWPDWTIIGGESGPRHRGIPDGAGWIENAVRDFRVFSKVFVKQDSGLKPGKQGRIPNEYFVHEFPV